MSYYDQNAYNPRDSPQFEEFKATRMYIFLPTAISCAIVLGIAISFATLFLPNLHRPFIVYSLVVPSGTIFMIILMMVQDLPPEASDVAFLCVIAALWLTLGAWSEDKIGHIQCFSLIGQTIPTKSGVLSSQRYCERMKVIEAFSWVAFILMLVLTYFAYKFVNEGHFGRYYGRNRSSTYSAVPQMPGQAPYVVQQQPGHSVVIQNTPAGQPIIQQLPSVATSNRF